MIIHDNHHWNKEVSNPVEYKLKMTVNGHYDEVNYQNYSFKTIEEAKVLAAERTEEVLNICHKKDGSPLTLKDIEVIIERKEICGYSIPLDDLLKYESYYTYFDKSHKRLPLGEKV